MQKENKKKKKRKDKFCQDENTTGAGGKIQKLQKNGDWMQQGGELFPSNLWQNKKRTITMPMKKCKVLKNTKEWRSFTESCGKKDVERKYLITKQGKYNKMIKDRKNSKRN